MPGRGSRASRQERLGQVDARQDPRRLPRARSMAAMLQFNGEPVTLPLKPGDYRAARHVLRAPEPRPRAVADRAREPAPRASSPARRTRLHQLGTGARRARQRLDALRPRPRPSRARRSVSPVAARAAGHRPRLRGDRGCARRQTGKPGLVLLDEPTPFLPASGVAQLFALVRSITALRLERHLHLARHRRGHARSPTASRCCATAQVAGELDAARRRPMTKIVEMIVGRSLAPAPVA